MKQSQSLFRRGRRRSTGRAFPSAVSRPISSADALEPRRLLTSAAISFDTHTEFTAGATPVAIVTADFNHDGNADLAVADAPGNTVDLFFGNGAGSFTAGPVLALPASPSSMVVGDFDGNGLPDIAVGEVAGGNNTVSVFLNVAATPGIFGTAQTTTVTSNASTAQPIALATGDFNGDGHLDLAATDYSQGTVSILLGTGASTFNTPTSISLGGINPTSILSADFNNDGHLDLAVADTFVTSTSSSTPTTTEQAITLLQGSGTGTFTVAASTALPSTGADAIAAADVNNDGKIDLVYGSTDETGGVLLNAGAFAFTAEPSGFTDGSIAAVTTGDFNVDGNADVVFANGGPSTLSSSGTVLSGVAELTLGTGAGDGTFSTTGTVDTATNPVAVVVGDFNNDGKPDIATADSSSGQVSLLLNNTAVTVLKPTTTTLTASSASPVSGVALTFTATVATTGEGFDSGTPTGTVKFFDGPTLLATDTLTGVTDQATFTTSLLAVGTDTIKATFTPTGVFAASSATLSAIVAPGSNSGPDLTPAILSTTLPAVIVPGETATARVQVTNSGDELASGTLVNALFLSSDGLVDSGATAVLNLKGSFARTAIRLTPGKSITLTGQFTVPTTLAGGTYTLLADVNVNDTVSERSTTNNAAAASSSTTLVDEFGTVGGRRGVVLTLADAAGTAVTYRLSGPGFGTVTTGASGTDVALTSTTGASALTVSGAGATLHDLASASLLGSVRASGVNFDGALDFSAGVTRLAVGNLNSATVTVGGGTVAAASFGAMVGSAVNAAGGISALSFASWPAGNALNGAWVNSLSSKGLFGGNLTLSGAGAPGGVALRSANLLGGVTGGIWSIAGSVNTLTLGSAGAAAGFSGSIGGTLRNLSDAGGFAGDLAAANFSSVLIRGSLTAADLLAGTGFGTDGVPGGGDDTFAAGAITSLRVLGSVTDSLVTAGLSSATDITLPSSDDTLLSGGAIRSLTVNGAVDAASKFLAAALPATVRLDGASEDPSSDAANFAL